MKWYHVASVKTITYSDVEKPLGIRIQKWIPAAAVVNAGGRVQSRGLEWVWLPDRQRPQPISGGSRVGGGWHRSKANKAGSSPELTINLGLHTFRPCMSENTCKSSMPEAEAEGLKTSLAN